MLASSPLFNLPWIDSHQHFWQLSRGDYLWLTPELAPLYQDFLPHDLEPVIELHNISHTLLVQAAPTTAETEFMLSLAAQHDFIAGVVGWVDFEQPEQAIEQLSQWLADPYFVGVRPMVQDIDEKGWLLKREFAPIFDFMADNNIAFDALIKPQHIGQVCMLAKRHPNLSVVIDHAAKPKIRNGIHGYDGYQAWRRAISECADINNIYCKVSGLLTEAKPDSMYIDLKPYLNRLLTVFGSHRLMWGSDWPVIKLSSDYQYWLEISKRWLDRLNDEDQRNITHLTAEKFYRLKL